MNRMSLDLPDIQCQLRELQTMVGGHNEKSGNHSRHSTEALASLQRLGQAIRSPVNEHRVIRPGSKRSNHRSKPKAPDRRFDMSMVVLDFVHGNPTSYPYSKHKELSKVEMSLYKSMDEAMYREEILRCIKSIDGLASYRGSFEFV